MYSYHNRIKQRISNNECSGYYETENHNGIKPALVLVFKTEPFLRPIRSHRFKEYQDVIIFNQIKRLDI